jgi:UDP-glucose 4-epimerase
MKVLVTGATGFVGRGLLKRLRAEGWQVRAVVRNRAVDLGEHVETIPLGDLGQPHLDYGMALQGCEAVIHLAARVHMLQDTAEDPLAEFRRLNTAVTRSLARQAADAGVTRFIFLSSIKVNGEETFPGKPFRVTDEPNPADPYGISKLEAEQELQRISRASGLRSTIIRTPLVYGPGVKANFQEMMRWVARGVPLPFGAVVHNRRSFIALDNLIDLIVTCARRAPTSEELFLASDGEDLSTADLLQRLGRALGAPARLLPIPAALLSALGAVTGRAAQMRRLLGSLQVDSSYTRQQLGWNPPVPVDAALASTAVAFLNRSSS